MLPRAPSKPRNLRSQSRTAHVSFSPHYRRSLLALALLVGAIAIVSVPNTVQPGDAGEFSTVMLRGGIPHPSGYPWMRMLGAAAQVLESIGVPSATAAAAPCALLAIAGFIATGYLLASIVPSTYGAVIVSFLAGSPLFVRHAYDAEVWGPHLFFCALVSLWCWQRRSPLLIGLALGAAVANHLTAILLLPMAAGAAWPTDGGAKEILRAGLYGVLGSSICLLVFGTLALGEGGAWRWGDTETWSGWFHHVTRGDFGSFQLSIQKHGAPPLTARLSRVLTSLGDTWTVGAVRSPWVASVFLATVAWCSQLHQRVPRPLYLGWVSCLILTTIVFPSAQNIDPTTPFGQWINERFDLLPALLWTPAFAAALHRLESYISIQRVRAILIPAALTILAAQFVRSWHERPQRLRGTEVYARDMLESPGTPNAIIIGTDDHRTFPALYVAEVSPSASQALYIDAALLYHPWYRSWILQRRPDLPIQELPVKTITAILKTPALQDTPVYLSNIFSKPSGLMPLVPEGLLLRVVPPHAPPDFISPEALARRHLEATERLVGTRADFQGADDPATDPFGANLWSRYALGARELARNLEAAGRADLAEEIASDALSRGVTPTELGTPPIPAKAPHVSD